MQVRTRFKQIDPRGEERGDDLAFAVIGTIIEVLSIAVPLGAKAAPTAKHGEDLTITAK